MHMCNKYERLCQLTSFIFKTNSEIGHVNIFSHQAKAYQLFATKRELMDEILQQKNLRDNDGWECIEK